MSEVIPRYEDPAALRRRLKLGREEFCQRLITTLIVGGSYPRWNSRSRPTPQGERFLALLFDLAGHDGWQPDPTFVDELELRPRHDDERGGAPDWAVLWADRTWLIELKTEAGSHRPGQLPLYADLGRHHFPGTEVLIGYVTPPLRRPVPPLEERDAAQPPAVGPGDAVGATGLGGR